MTPAQMQWVAQRVGEYVERNLEAFSCEAKFAALRHYFEDGVIYILMGVEGKNDPTREEAEAKGR